MIDESTQGERRSDLGEPGVGWRIVPEPATFESAAGGAAGVSAGATAGGAAG